MNKCPISRTCRPVFRPNGTTLCQPRATPWEIFHAMISSPNGAALIFAVTSSNLFILHTVRNDAVDFLAIVPSPPQLIFPLDTFSTGERARVRGKECIVFWFILTPGQPPHPACRPPSPLAGCRFNTNPKRQRGKHFKRKGRRNLFASLALRVSETH